MDIAPFQLERYFARYEFSAPHLLSSSDCDGLAVTEVLGMADVEARGLWENLRLGYTEPLGLPQLRAEVAGLYAGVSADEVIVGAPEELIFVAMNCLLKQGDHVICSFPGYQSLYQVAEALGCEVTRWLPREEEGWRFALGDLRATLRPSTKLIVVNFPHNPTGALPPRADFEAIASLAAERDAYLFSDEMYRLLELDAAHRLPSAVELYHRAVALFGMSKTFGLAGVRIGWLVTHDPALYKRMAAFKDYTTICSSAPSEVLSLIALRAREQIVASHLERVRRNLAVLDQFFARRGELFAWVRPRAGTICLPRLLGDVGPATEFCRRVVEEAGIMIVPATVFDYDDRHIRVGYGRENLPDVLDRLDRYLEQAMSGVPAGG